MPELVLRALPRDAEVDQLRPLVFLRPMVEAAEHTLNQVRARAAEAAAEFES